MSTPPHSTAIPLHWLDLTPEDQARVLGQIARAPFHDPPLVERWEALWGAAWGRPAVAFADATEALAALAGALGWPPGQRVACDPWCSPPWREGLAVLGQVLTPWDRDPWDGLPAGRVTAPVALAVHPWGLPLSRERLLGVVPGAALLLEDVTPLSLPLSGSGWGDVQLACLDGNAPLKAGGGVVLMARDAALAVRLRLARQQLPGPVACALGLSQWQRLGAMLERRGAIAAGYGRLRHRGLFRLPPVPPGGRAWERFVILAVDGGRRESLVGFLGKGGIGAGGPFWYRPLAGSEGLPGVRETLARGAALPLYAALAPAAAKRVINRVHRWAQRQE